MVLLLPVLPPAVWDSPTFFLSLLVGVWLLLNNSLKIFLKRTGGKYGILFGIQSCKEFQECDGSPLEISNYVHNCSECCVVLPGNVNIHCCYYYFHGHTIWLIAFKNSHKQPHLQILASHLRTIYAVLWNREELFAGAAFAIKELPMTLGHRRLTISNDKWSDYILWHL